MQVLLIEPDAILSTLYQTTLEQAGHAVVTTTSAQLAVHCIDEQLPDVVVLELQLPHHNGIEFLYELRSYNEWQKLPVIIHTFVLPSDLTAAATLQRELGVVQILHKPSTSLAQLQTAVQNAVPTRV